MEKLINLLNQYKEEAWMNCYWYETSDWPIVDQYWPALSETVLISRNYWFIKWLLENKMLQPKDTAKQYILEAVAPWEDYKCFLQRLATSETPINDLISYLK